jgi:putative spermidine/putrescine transport system permease protein
MTLATSEVVIMRPRTRARSSMALVLIGPATLFCLLQLLVPVAILFRYSLNRFDPAAYMVDAVTAENYVKFFTDPYYLTVLVRTIRVSVVSTLICLVMGFPLAYWLARMTSRWKNLMVILVVLPLFIGNAVRAAGWMTLFGAKGFINSVLLAVGLIDQPLTLMYTELAVVVGIITVNLPYMVLTLQSVLEGIARPIEEAALSLGAPPFQAFRRVVWPLALPGTLAGTILTFILAMNAYATPVLLGGPKFTMMGPLVYDQFSQSNNWPFGAAVSFVLMATTLGLTFAAHTALRRRSAGAG